MTDSVPAYADGCEATSPEFCACPRKKADFKAPRGDLVVTLTSVMVKVNTLTVTSKGGETQNPNVPATVCSLPQQSDILSPFTVWVARPGSSQSTWLS